MGFPYYGHSVFWFWIDILLAYTGWIPLWFAAKFIWKKNANKIRIADIIILLFFIFWLPHSLYLSLELPKNLYYQNDGILRGAPFLGIIIYGAVSLLGFISAVGQIIAADYFWKKYKNKGNRLILNLVIFGAALGVLIGLQGVNFYHSFESIIEASRNIIFLNDPYNRFLGFGPLKLGLMLFAGLHIARRLLLIGRT